MLSSVTCKICDIEWPWTSDIFFFNAEGVQILKLTHYSTITTKYESQSSFILFSKIDQEAMAFSIEFVLNIGNSQSYLKKICYELSYSLW